MPAEEDVLILVKPDGVLNGHIGEVITRLEKRCFNIKFLKVIQATNDQLKRHYKDLVDKPFYPNIEKYMKETPIVAIVASGINIIETFRKLAGTTNPMEAEVGTIRGEYGQNWDGQSAMRNVVHSSDSVENAKREIAIWFPDFE